MTVDYEIRLVELAGKLLEASNFLSWNNADEQKLKEHITYLVGYISALDKS